MFRVLTAIFLCLTLAGVPSLSLAAAASAGKDKAGESSARGTKKQLSTIVFSGVAGAILGLSTLSFYGRPQDRLSNIAIGAAIGVIGGAMFSTFKAATEPRDFYNQRDAAGSELWALDEQSRRRETGGSSPMLGLKLAF